jgi:zinc resistance-associated protein
MRSLTVAAAAALTISGVAVAAAQQQAAPAPAGSQLFERWRPSADDIGALTDARIAGLKAGLRLTPAQEQHWPPVERVIREAARERFDRFTARSAAARVIDPIERLRQRADAMTSRANTIRRLADAAAPLYQSLDEAQKRRFSMLARMAGPRRGAPGFWRRDRDGGGPPR